MRYFAGDTVDFATEDIADGVVLYKKRKVANDYSTIIAHGGYRGTANKFNVPEGLDIHFLAVHQAELVGPPHMMLRALVSDILPAEIVRGGSCSYDYVLGHFQIPGVVSEMASTYRGVRGIS